MNRIISNNPQITCYYKNAITFTVDNCNYNLSIVLYDDYNFDCINVFYKDYNSNITGFFNVKIKNLVKWANSRNKSFNKKKTIKQFIFYCILEDKYNCFM